MSEVIWPGVMEGIHLGVTGTRHRVISIGEVPTTPALISLKFLITAAYSLGATTLHHGACTGWDEQAVQIAYHHTKLIIEAHPPTSEQELSQQSLDMSHVVNTPATYKRRNENIAIASELLFAGGAYPEHDPLSKRSGTWQTARLARRYGDRVYAVSMTGDIYDATEAAHDRT